MIRIWISLLGVVYGVGLLIAVGISTSTSSQGEVLACSLASDKQTYHIGEVPKLSVRITNLTDRELCLIGSLDGSDCGWRYPHCSFEIATPYGRPRWPGRCGNTNPLREKDFVKVSPGGLFDPYQQIDEYGFFHNALISERTFKSAGEYRLRFVYCTGPKGAAAGDNPLAELIAQVPKVRLVSNEITVRFLAVSP